MDTRQRFDGHGYRQQSANWQAAVDRRLTTLNASWVRCAFIVHHLLCSPPLGNRVTRYTPSRPSVRPSRVPTVNSKTEQRTTVKLSCEVT